MTQLLSAQIPQHLKSTKSKVLTNVKSFVPQVTSLTLPQNFVSLVPCIVPTLQLPVLCSTLVSLWSSLTLSLKPWIGLASTGKTSWTSTAPSSQVLTSITFTHQWMLWVSKSNWHQNQRSTWLQRLFALSLSQKQETLCNSPRLWTSWLLQCTHPSTVWSGQLHKWPWPSVMLWPKQLRQLNIHSHSQIQSISLDSISQTLQTGTKTSALGPLGVISIMFTHLLTLRHSKLLRRQRPGLTFPTLLFVWPLNKNHQMPSSFQLNGTNWRLLCTLKAAVVCFMLVILSA